MNQFLTNLKYQAEQNPIAALAVGVAALTVVNRVFHTGVEMQNASAWRKEVARRAMKDALK